MSDKRRAEIEAKRAKLAELRRVRADRQKAESERRVSEVSTPPKSVYFHWNIDSLVFLLQQSAAPSTVRREVDDILSTFGVSTSRGGIDSGDLTPSSSIPGSPSLGYTTTGLPGQTHLTLSGRVSRQSDVQSDRVTPVVQSATASTDHVIER